MANQILIKNTMQDMRDLPAEEIAGLQGTTPIYSGVKLLGYYKKGDTPEPIIYYLAPTDFGPDDGGSVIAIGGIKLIHNFVGNVNVLYFGAKGVEAGGQPPYPDDYKYLQNALNYCAGKGKCISLPGRKFYTSKTLSIPHDSIGGGIVSEQGSNSYIKSCIELMATSTDLYTIRNYSQGSTFKDVAIRGRSVSIANSVAVLFKRVDEYLNSGDPWKDDLENNIDAVIEGCDFGNANRDNFALINNKTTDGYGFDIIGNFSDSFNIFFMGNLVNSLVASNIDYTQNQPAL